MSSITTPNMNLIEPTVGSQLSPTWAYNINTSLTLIDQHDHTPGKGVPISPAGLDINSDLSLGGNFLTNIAGLVLSAQGSTPDVNTIYESGVDLYFVDGLGNNIQITANGGVAGTPGSISNLVSPASASYVSASSKFVWQSNTNIAADMDFGAAIMRNLSPNSTFALTLQPPTALSSNYSLTLPVLPLSKKIMTLDASGNIAGDYGVDNSTIEISSNNLQVKNQGITAAKIANGTITTTQIAAAAGILQSQLSLNAFELSDQVIQSSTSFVVPNNANYLFYLGCGGGGGGGGGGSASSGTFAGGGGAGGRGSQPQFGIVNVVPGETLTITIGAGGTAGSAGSGNTNGGSGGNGGNTTIAGSLMTVVLGGGTGGAGGTRGNAVSPAAGGAGAASLWTPRADLTSGGSGSDGTSAGASAGSDGDDGRFADGGNGGNAAASGSARGGAGGGGGCGLGNGGNGGNAASGSGNSGTAGSVGGAGGGGGSGCPNNTTAGAGGAGGKGILVLMWIAGG